MSDILFTHFDPVTKKELNFNVTRLLASPRTKRIAPTAVSIDKTFALNLPQLRGLERHRVARLMHAIKDGVELDPLLFCMMPDGSALLVDGNHRYYAYATMNVWATAAKLLPETLWKKYLVEGLPPSKEEIVKAAFSGIL